MRLIGKDAHPRGWIYEHRWVVEQWLGRRLESHEVVHHRNGIKTDNRLENLQLIDAAEHMAHHQRVDRHPNSIAGRWAEHFDVCVTCGGSDRAHAARGECYRCYDRKYQKILRANQGAVPTEVRRAVWSVDQDGNIYDACLDCGRDNVRPGARGRCQACVRYRRLHDGRPRPGPVTPKPRGDPHAGS